MSVFCVKSRLRAMAAVGALIAMACAGQAQAQPGSGTTRPASSGATLVSSTTGTGALTSRLGFQENRGQYPAEVLFVSRTRGGSVWFTKDSIVLQLARAATASGVPAAGDPAVSSVHRPAAPPTTVYDRAALRMVGSSPATRAVGAEPLPVVENFFVGARSRWATSVRTFGALSYRQLYPGIDVEFRWVGNRLRSLWTVQPGADPRRIAWRYSGAAAGIATKAQRALARVAEGSLSVRLPGGQQLLDVAPTAQQCGTRACTEAGVRFSPQRARGVYGFTVGRYDVRRVLRIDPDLEYSSFQPGMRGGYIQDMQVDGAGNKYLIGELGTDDYDTSSNAYQRHLNGDGITNGYDAVISKITPGGAFVSSTYLGGSKSHKAQPGDTCQQSSDGVDVGNGLAIDSRTHDVVVVGNTTSVDFPLRHAAQPRFNSGDSGFLTRLSPNLSSLRFSTYVGGTMHLSNCSAGAPQAVAITRSGDVYIGGRTDERAFAEKRPIMPSPWRGVATSLWDGFTQGYVRRYDGQGRLEMSSFVGAATNSHPDITLVRDLAVDAHGRVVLLAHTCSGKFTPIHGRPPAPGRHVCWDPIDGNAGWTSQDVLLLRINSRATGLDWLTYFGGSSTDVSRSVAIGPSDAIFVAGMTRSRNLPTLHAVQPVRKNTRGTAGWLAKFEQNGKLAYATYLGGSDRTDFDTLSTAAGPAGAQSYEPQETVGDIAVSRRGEAVVIGSTPSLDFPTVRPYQAHNASAPSPLTADDYFVARFSANGRSLLFSTYLGGSGEDSASSDNVASYDGHVALDQADRVHLAGFTESLDFPTTEQSKYPRNPSVNTISSWIAVMRDK
jgi:hypothetical protein